MSDYFDGNNYADGYKKGYEDGMKAAADGRIKLHLNSNGRYEEYDDMNSVQLPLSSKEGKVSFILGIASVLMPVLSLIPGIIGLIFGIKAKIANPNDRFALAGIIISVIGLFFGLLSFVVIIIAVAGSGFAG